MNVWEFASGKATEFVTGDWQNLFDLHFSPDGDHILTICEDRTRIWTIDGKPADWESALGGWCGSYSADGKYIAIVSNRVVEIIDAKTGHLVARIDPEVLFFPVAVWTADSNKLIVADADGHVYSWSPAGASLWSRHHIDGISGQFVHLLPNDSEAVTFSAAGDSGITRRNLQTGKTLVEYHQEAPQFLRSSNPYQGFAMSGDGARIVGITSRQDLRCWDSQTGKEIWHWHWEAPSSHGEYWWALASCHACLVKGRELIAVGHVQPYKGDPNAVKGSTVTILDAITGEELTRLVSNCWNSDIIDWEPASNRLAGCDQSGRITAWDLDSLATVGDVESPPNTRHSSMTFSNNGEWLIAGDTTGGVEVWNTESWTLQTKQRVSDAPVPQLLPMLDDATLLAITNGRVLILDAQTAVVRGELELPGPVMQVYLDHRRELVARMETGDLLLRLDLPSRPPAPILEVPSALATNRRH